MIRNWKVGLLLILGLVTNSLLAQDVTFSRRFDLGSNALIFTAIIPSNDGEFKISGPVFGEEPFVYNGTQLLVLDRYGDLVDSARLGPETSVVEGWGNEMVIDQNGDIFISGDNYDRGRSFFIGKFSGLDYIPSYNVYWNPDFPSSSFTVSSGLLNAGGNTLLYGGVERPNSDVNGQKAVIFRINEALEFIDTNYIECFDPFSCRLQDLKKRRNGGYYGFVSKNERGVRCEPRQLFEFYHLDENLNIVNSYTSSEDEAWYDGRIYEDENGDVYLQLAEIEYQNFIIDLNNPDDCISSLRFSPRLIKLDSNLNRVWTKDLNRQVDSSGAYPGVAEILPASDGPGMVAVSSQWNKQTRMAHLIRFDTAGNKLWHRTYGFFDTTDTSVFVYDAKVANDGGYVLVGEVKIARTQENLDLGRFPTQQGWIMKVDEEGCLIPGCGSETVITSVAQGAARPAPSVVLYPNPVEDMLMFRMNGLRGVRSVSGMIHDASGRLVRSVPERRIGEDTTLLLDVDALKAGIYFLRLQFDDGQIVSEKFVKR